MKHVGSLFSKLAAYGVALLVTVLVASAQAQPRDGQAQVTAIRGTASVQEGGGEFKPLKVYAVLHKGAVVRTAANSQVDLFLKQNGPVVRVTPESTLALNSLLFDDTKEEVVIETKLDLSNGRILGNVKKLANASKYEVKIPTGTVGIRGTEYDISANGKVSVDKGSALVTLTGQAGPGTVVNQGQTFSPPAAGQTQGTVSSTPPGQANTTSSQINSLTKGAPTDFVQGPTGLGTGPTTITVQKPTNEKTGSDSLTPPTSNPQAKPTGTTPTSVNLTYQTLPGGTQGQITYVNPDGSKTIVTVPITTNPTTGQQTVTIGGVTIPAPKPTDTTITLPTVPIDSEGNVAPISPTKP